MKIPPEVCDLIDSGTYANYITLNPDGSPHVSVVWIGLDGDEIVSGHLAEVRKIKNLKADPRVAICLQANSRSALGLREYVVLYGRARIVEGGAPELLQHLANIYFGPGVKYPPIDNPPQGFVTHVQVDRIAGVGPWTGKIM